MPPISRQSLSAWPGEQRDRIRRFQIDLPKHLPTAAWPRLAGSELEPSDSDLLFHQLFLRAQWSGMTGSPPTGPLAWLYDVDPFPCGTQGDQKSREHRITGFLGELADMVSSQAIDSLCPALPDEDNEDGADAKARKELAQERERAEAARRSRKDRLVNLREEIESSCLASLTQYRLWLACRWLLNERRQNPHRQYIREALMALGRDDWLERVRSQSRDLRRTFEARLLENSGYALIWPDPLVGLYDALNAFERFAAKYEEAEKDQEFLPRPNGSKFLQRPFGGYVRDLMYERLSRGDNTRPPKLTSRTEDPIARRGAEALDAVLREGGIGVAAERYRWIGRIFDAVYPHASRKSWACRTIRKYAESSS